MQRLLISVGLWTLLTASCTHVQPVATDDYLYQLEKTYVQHAHRAIMSKAKASKRRNAALAASLTKELSRLPPPATNSTPLWKMDAAADLPRVRTCLTRARDCTRLLALTLRTMGMFLSNRALEARMEDIIQQLAVHDSCLQRARGQTDTSTGDQREPRASSDPLARLGRLLTKHKVNAALVVTDQLLKRNPEDTSALQVKAWLIALAKGDVASATRLLTAAAAIARAEGAREDAMELLLQAGDIIAHSPLNPEDQRRHRRGQAWNRKVEAASVQYLAALKELESAPESELQQLAGLGADAHVRIGELFYYYTQRLAEAQQSFRQALALKPTHFLGHYRLAQALARNQDQQGAIRHLRAAIKASPRFRPAHSFLCHLYRRDNDLARAVEACEQAIIIDPQYTDGYDALSAVYWQLGNPQKAKSLLTKAARIEDRADIRSRLGRMYMLSKEYSAAARELRHSVQLAPDNADTREHLGDALFELKDYDEAYRQYRASLKIRTRHYQKTPRKQTYMRSEMLPLYLRLGVIASILKRWSEAKSYYEKVTTYDSQNPRHHLRLSFVYKELKDLKRAALAARRAIELNPDLEDGWLQLGHVQMAKKQYREAHETFTGILKKNPKNTSALNSLAIIYLTQKKFNKSLQVLYRIIKADPGFETAYYNIACVYSVLRKKKLALDWLEKALMKGFDQRGHMDQDSDLDNIRQEKRYKVLLEQYLAPQTRPKSP